MTRRHMSLPGNRGTLYPICQVLHKLTRYPSPGDSSRSCMRGKVGKHRDPLRLAAGRVGHRQPSRSVASGQAEAAGGHDVAGFQFRAHDPAVVHFADELGQVADHLPFVFRGQAGQLGPEGGAEILVKGMVIDRRFLEHDREHTTYIHSLLARYRRKSAGK